MFHKLVNFSTNILVCVAFPAQSTHSIAINIFELIIISIFSLKKNIIFAKLSFICYTFIS